MAKRKGSAATRIGAVDSMDDAIAALEEMERINAEIEEQQRYTVDLKKNVTAWAVDHQVEVIQLGDHYYRQIRRFNRGWDADKLKEIVKGKKDKKGKPIWNAITRRVPDPEKISSAVRAGLLKQKEVDKAFVEKPQAPFLQKFQGEAYGESD